VLPHIGLSRDRGQLSRRLRGRASQELLAQVNWGAIPVPPGLSREVIVLAQAISRAIWQLIRGWRRINPMLGPRLRSTRKKKTITQFRGQGRSWRGGRGGKEGDLPRSRKTVLSTDEDVEGIDFRRILIELKKEKKKEKKFKFKFKF